MQFIWRFYTGEDTQWRWQKLSVDRAVVAESASGYAGYEDCVTNASDQGYVFHPHQPAPIRTLPRWSAR